MKPQRRRIRKRIQKPKYCFYCKQRITPDYKEIETLKHFISERGKIVGRIYNGVCQKHQLMLAKAVKRSRYLALLPYIVRPA